MATDYVLKNKTRFIVLYIMKRPTPLYGKLQSIVISFSNFIKSNGKIINEVWVLTFIYLFFTDQGALNA